MDDGEKWIEGEYTYWLKLAQDDDVDNVYFRQWPVQIQALVDLDRDVQQVAHHGIPERCIDERREADSACIYTSPYIPASSVPNNALARLERGEKPILASRSASDLVDQLKPRALLARRVAQGFAKLADGEVRGGHA